MNNRDLSVVIPVYNEEETLAYSVQRLTAALAPLKAAGWTRIELIFVNDGSRDRTTEILNELVNRESHGLIRIRVLHLSRNFGHSAAVIAGLEATVTSNANYVAIIDADLQDPPELIPEMLEALVKGGHDVVFGQRKKRSQESSFKKLTAWTFYRVLDRLTGIEIPKDTGDFRVMTREIVSAVLSCSEADPFLRGLVAWVGFDQKAFLYTREGRKFGTTKYPFSKMLKFASTAIVGFSDVPLRISFLLGFLGLVFFAVLVVWALYVNYMGRTVPGWTSLLIGFLLGQSLTLLIIGIVGYYVGQTFKQVQGRPRYILRQDRRGENDSR